MSRFSTVLMLTAALPVLTSIAQAQFNATGLTTLSVNVGSEAAIQINTTTTGLTTSSGAFASDFTGQTSFTYKIRTGASGGTGSVTLQVTSDFNAGGPSVANPPSANDKLAYTCSLTSPA